MHKTLYESPVDRPLILIAIQSESLMEKLHRLGFYEGSVFARIDREVISQTIRVRGTGGDFTLGGGMSSKIVVHLDDGRKLPLVDMSPGERGHIEGLTGGDALSETLTTLGFKLDDKIEFVRRIPPMEYLTQVEDERQVRLNEGQASKIWGHLMTSTVKQPVQFCSTQVRKPFKVRKILGGQNVRQSLESLGIIPEIVLYLKTVERAKILQESREPSIAVSIPATGLRFFLHARDGRKIIVEEAK
jgi:Fe2+ transport system protein FeoA